MNAIDNRPLAGSVAVVTGASRGAGRGIAEELGAAGATVFVTGRSTGTERPPEYDRMLGPMGVPVVPGTIEETAEAVTRAGGRGVAVRCDHTKEDEVRALFARVEREGGRLDLLVNNAWGGNSLPIGQEPFWEQPMAHWDGMFDRGVRNHIVAGRAAAPIFIRQRRGLIVTVSFWDRDKYVANFFYDLAKAGMNRLAFGMAQELRPHGVASVAISPGWMRTEFVLAGFKGGEARWKEHPQLARTETPRYVGRGVVALAADPEVMGKTGGVYRVGDLAKEYGFTDVDGRTVPPFEM